MPNEDDITLPGPPDEKEMREHKHWETGPAVTVSAPDDYPLPKAGKVTRWSLTTPDKESVGTLLFDAKGVYWYPAAGVSADAQEHAAEILSYLRGHKQEDIALADALAGIKDAYAGDFTEDQVHYAPTR